MRNDLYTAKSRFWYESPRRTLRLVLPNVKGAGATKQLVSNQRSNVGLARRPSQIRLGGVPTAVLLMSPDHEGVNGNPLWRIRIPAKLQPPRTCFAACMLLLRKKGSS